MIDGSRGDLDNEASLNANSRYKNRTAKIQFLATMNCWGRYGSTPESKVSYLDFAIRLNQPGNDDYYNAYDMTWPFILK